VPESTTELAAVDLVVIALYLGLVMGLGSWFVRRKGTTRDYFRGSGRVPWWAAGLSLYGTGLSALTFIAIPALVYRTNWAYFVGMIAGVAAVPPVVRWVLPFYRDLDLTTAYEYLGRRFSRPVHLLGAATFIIFHLGRAAIMLVLPALVLSSVTNLELYTSIAVIGVVAVIYTMLGGIEAVIWTDVMQVIVLIGGAGAAAASAIWSLEGGVGEFFSVALEHEKLALWNPGFDPTAAAPVLWVIFAGYGLSQFNLYVADQSLVQRYLTTRDTKQAARALWLAALGGVPVQLLFYTVGTAMFVFYAAHPDLKPDPALGDAIVPRFLMQQLPVGLAGLVVAGVFAAGMSTIDSSMNSIATTVVTDFVRPANGPVDEGRRLRLARGVTLGVGLLGTAGAMGVAAAEFEGLLNTFLGWLFLVMGVLAGLFVLGIASTRAHGPGALAGAAVAVVTVVSLRLATPLNFFLFAIIGLLACAGAGYLASLLLPGPERDLTGLTLHTRAARSSRP